ncbi:MAG: carboxypeptidase regulatory-like domain-containing protein [Polyangiaceae bacterium]|nr:carboxypeptidase regulatory-like domain-containing protein [Polyangiaceae bacterium]
MWGRWALGAVWGCACVSFALSGSAQPRDLAGAEKLYDDGSKLVKEGDWAGGCAKLEQSYALDPAPGTLLKLVSCAEHDGKVATAWSRLKDARSLNADTKSEAQRKEMESFIDASIARLTPRLPFVTVRVKPAVTGLVVMRDGQASVEGVELPLDPGRHVIEVSAPGYAAVRREIEAVEGKRSTVEIELLPEAPGAKPELPTPPQPSGPVPPRPSEPSSSPSGGLTGLQVAGIVLGGVGVASLGAAIGTGVAALDKESQLNELGCEPTASGTLGCGPAVIGQAEALSSEGSTLALASTVTTFIGAGLAGGGLLMALLGGERSSTEARVPGVRVVGGPGDAGLALWGAF